MTGLIWVWGIVLILGFLWRRAQQTTVTRFFLGWAAVLSIVFLLMYGGGSSTSQSPIPRTIVHICSAFFVCAFIYIYTTICLGLAGQRKEPGAPTTDFLMPVLCIELVYMLSVATLHYRWGYPMFASASRCLVVLVLAPLPLYTAVKRYLGRRQRAVHGDPGRLAELALQLPESKRFCENFDDVQVFVTRVTKREQTQARCVYLHRRPVPGEECFIDQVLQVTVDIRTGEVDADWTAYQAYAFVPKGNRSRMVVLDQGPDMPESLGELDVDGEALSQLRDGWAVFPCLDDVPLPLSAQGIKYQRVGSLKFAPAEMS